MGQGRSGLGAWQVRGVDRASLTDQEYEALQRALGVVNDVPDATVSLPTFLGRFPPHLRPLVQPLLFRLARERGARPSRWELCEPRDQRLEGAATSSSGADDEGELCVPWPGLVAGISFLVSAGATWPMLLEAWVGQDQSDASLAARAEAAAELAAALCFWCAHPSLAPGPGAPGGMTPSAAAAAAAGCDPDPLKLALTALRPSAAVALSSEVEPKEGDAAAVAARLAENAPCLPRSVGPRLAQALLELPAAPERPELKSRILEAGLAFLLRGVSEALWASGPPELLYGDWCDGRSFGSLLRAVASYRGLSVLLLRASGGGEVLGAVTDTWEEGNGSFGGGTGCLLFALWPSLRAFRSTGKSRNYAYLNSRSKAAPRGLGFGGQQGSCRLWIDADFEECKVLPSDATFTAGPLLAEGRTCCSISHIEVLGFGGEAAHAAQQAHRSRELAGNAR